MEFLNIKKKLDFSKKKQCMKNNDFLAFLNKPHYKIAVVTKVMSNNASDVFYLNSD